MTDRLPGSGFFAWSVAPCFPFVLPHPRGSPLRSTLSWLISRSTSTPSRWSTTAYYLTDAQGSVRALTDNLGSVTDTYAYDDLLAQSGTTVNPYLYTGQRFDAATDTYYLRAREYDPVVGRFLSRDTWGVDTWHPAELNRYVYAAANPVMLNDPTGTLAIAGRGILDTTISLPNIPILQGLGAVLAGMLTGLLACEMSMQVISLMELAGIDTTFVRAIAPDGCEPSPKDEDDEEEKCDYRVLRYNEQPSPRPENCEAHHPMPSVWMSTHYRDYNPNEAWTILMPRRPDHVNASAVMMAW